MFRIFGFSRKVIPARAGKRPAAQSRARTLMSNGVLAGLVLGAALVIGLPASASAATLRDQRADPFSALVGRERRKGDDTGSVERYVTASGDRVFLFEPYGDAARIKFLCGPGDQRIDCLIDETMPAEEIFILNGHRAPRGDTIYKNAVGKPVLRLTSYGGLTVFWPSEEQGRAASRSFGDDASLSLFPVTAETAQARAKTATALVSARLGRPVEFLIDEPAGLDEQNGAAVLADAVARAAKAIVRSDHRERVRAPAFRTVRFRAGAEPAATVDGETLIVVYNPHRDIRGRVSSAELIEAIDQKR